MNFSFSYLWTLEVLSVLCGLVYLVLIIKENIWGWPFGIIGSALSIVLFIESKLYSEAILYGYYVLIGIYGWWLWSKPKAENKITVRGWKFHFIAIVSCLSLTGIVGYLFSTYTDADKPYFDGLTSVFSYFASYLEAKKILSSWFYWIGINVLTIGLYYTKDLSYYSALMLVYFGLSVFGYYKWKKVYQAQ
jgi:nicotinamide mononucleotide transporter